MTSSGFCSYSRNMERSETSRAFEASLTPNVGGIDTTSNGERVFPLNIIVIFTVPDATIAALKQAGQLAESLGGRIVLVVPQIVPYPLPLTSPPVSLDFQEKRFRVIAAESP